MAAAAPETAPDRIREFSWKALALVKLSDVAWCSSQPFNDMPRVSAQVPPEADGSMGSVFNCWHAGLRTYETVERKGGVKAGSAWLVSVQTETANIDDLQQLVYVYSTKPQYRGHIVYKLVEGHLPYPEPPSPGNLPAGMLLIEFDGERPAIEAVSDVKVIRADIWKRKLARGDEGLAL